MIGIHYIHLYGQLGAYTDVYRACIWTSFGEFRYKQYESVYITLLIIKVFYYPNITNLYKERLIHRNQSHFRIAKTLIVGHAIYR